MCMCLCVSVDALAPWDAHGSQGRLPVLDSTCLRSLFSCGTVSARLHGLGASGGSSVSSTHLAVGMWVLQALTTCSFSWGLEI